jgi:anti-sigma regulatory factor (Ser/Thr protein kinase)
MARSAGDPLCPDRNAGGQRAAASPRWRRVFPGEERQLGVLRRWLTSLLPECPARDDVISVATELASNALLHTYSGGGSFGMEVTWDRSTVAVAVADSGGPAEPHVIDDPGGESGRGLLLVRALSVRTGVNGGDQGRTVWAQIAWDGPDLATPTPAPPSGEEAIRTDELALARRFTGVTAWFGRSTQAWWALTGQAGLVTAPTAPELANLLLRLPDAPASSRAAEHTTPATSNTAHKEG